jgi:methionine-rich copper-binding protein CopC
LRPRDLIPLAVVAVLLCGGIGPALAHAIIVEATPAVGAVVRGDALDIRLRFNSRIDHRRSRVSIIDALGKEKVVTFDANAATDEITARASGLTPGEYRLRWQVLALDGHITRGDIPFSVVAP